MNFSHSTYSRDGRGVGFYFTNLTKLGSNKRKVNQALIWDIISHYYKANIFFISHLIERVRYFGPQAAN